MDFRFQNNQVLCCSDIHRFSRHFVQTPPALGSCSTFTPSQCLCSGQAGPLFRGTRAWGGRSDVQQESGLRSDFCWVVSWVPRDRQPFPFKGRFLFHNLPTTSLLQGLLPGTGAAKKSGRRSWALALRMSGGPAALVPLQPDGWSQPTNWKMISSQRTQKAQEFLPSETKRELISSSKPQVLLGWFVRDDHHPTRILPQNVLSLSSPLL